MESLNLGWGFALFSVLLLLLLFFAGCLFMFGIYCTAISLIGKFPVKPVIVFWLIALTSSLTACINRNYGIALFVVSSPAIGMLFWYYERQYRRTKGESEIIVLT